MSRCISSLAICLFVASLVPTNASGDDVQSELLSRLDAMERSLDAQNRRFDEFDSRLNDLSHRSPGNYQTAAFAIGGPAIDEGYDDCTSCSDGCRYHIVAGAEGTYLKVNDDALGGFGLGGAPPRHAWQAAPRIWLGFEHDNGWGMRARYWQFRNATAPLNQVIQSDPTETAFVYADSRLEAYAVDWEITRRMNIGRWSLLGSIGARHARIGTNSQLNLAVIDDDPGDSFAFHLGLDRAFEGTGLTLGLQGERPVGCTPFSFFWNLRGSVLAGKTKAFGTFSDDSSDDPLQSGTLIGQASEAMWVGELQVGGQWSRELSCGGGLVFIRVMYETQTWVIPGLTADANNFELFTGPFNLDKNKIVFNGLTAAFGFVW